MNRCIYVAVGDVVCLFLLLLSGDIFCNLRLLDVDGLGGLGL